MKINSIAILTPQAPNEGEGELNLAYSAGKSYIWSQNVCGEFCKSSLMIYHFENLPYITFNFPRTKGIKFCLFGKESYI